MLATIDTPISITNIKNMNTREQNWLNGYEALKHYIEEHKQLPDKKKVGRSALLLLMRWVISKS